MLLFPETFVSVLVWGGLGLASGGVVLLASLWAVDAIKGRLW